MTDPDDDPDKGPHNRPTRGVRQLHETITGKRQEFHFEHLTERSRCEGSHVPLGTRVFLSYTGSDRTISYSHDESGLLVESAQYDWDDLLAMAGDARLATQENDGLIDLFGPERSFSCDSTEPKIIQIYPQNHNVLSTGGDLTAIEKPLMLQPVTVELVKLAPTEMLVVDLGAMFYQPLTSERLLTIKTRMRAAYKNLTDTLIGGKGTIFISHANRATETYGGHGNCASYTYEAEGNCTTLWHADGTRTTYAYHADGSRTTQTHDADDNCTTCTYDANGNCTTVWHADGSWSTYTYGNCTTLRHADGTRTTYAYDADGSRTTYTYDADGNCTTVWHADGSRMAYTYEAEGNGATYIHYVYGLPTNYVHDTYSDCLYSAVGNWYVIQQEELADWNVAPISIGSTPAFANWLLFGEYVLIIDVKNRLSVPAEVGGISDRTVRYFFERDLKTILVPSSGYGGGKSTTVGYLGIDLAQAGHRRTQLNDGDLRWPVQYKVFDIDASRGFISDVQARFTCDQIGATGITAMKDARIFAAAAARVPLGAGLSARIHNVLALVRKGGARTLRSESHQMRSCQILEVSPSRESVRWLLKEWCAMEERQLLGSPSAGFDELAGGFGGKDTNRHGITGIHGQVVAIIPDTAILFIAVPAGANVPTRPGLDCPDQIAASPIGRARFGGRTLRSLRGVYRTSLYPGEQQRGGFNCSRWRSAVTRASTGRRRISLRVTRRGRISTSLSRAEDSFITRSGRSEACDRTAMSREASSGNDEMA